MADHATSILLLDLKFVISPMFHLTFQGQISESLLTSINLVGIIQVRRQNEKRKFFEINLI